MNLRMPQALAAVFADRVTAGRCALELEGAGFARPWIAVTRPAEPDPQEKTAAETVAQNEVSETSDGALGAIGRFFTGKGRSLRRSLEDHGLDPDDAAAIDAALLAPSTVLVVDAESRRAQALEIVTAHGGATALPYPLAQAGIDSETEATKHPEVGPIGEIGAPAVAALEREEDAFYARRPPTS
jgi:hypothetical protein